MKAHKGKDKKKNMLKDLLKNPTENLNELNKIIPKLIKQFQDADK